MNIYLPIWALYFMLPQGVKRVIDLEPVLEPDLKLCSRVFELILSLFVYPSMKPIGSNVNLVDYRLPTS